MLNPFIKKTLLLLGFSFALFLILDYLYPLDTSRLQRDPSTLIYDTDGKLLGMRLSSDGYWRWESDDALPDRLKQSVLLFEDRYFYYHIGVNPFSIVRAALSNLTGSRTIGASTITMQVARMTYNRKRTYGSKIVEMFNALQLELHYTKDEILTMYLNLAPYGGNIEGVSAASYFYFDATPQELTYSQIALLTTIPKNPNSNRPDRAVDIYEKRNKVLQILLNRHIIDHDAYKRARSETIQTVKTKIPFLAPHFCNKIHSDTKVRTTLESGLQRKTLHILRKHLNMLSSHKISNGAVIVIDNRDMSVKAYIGSRQFFDTYNLGQNDGVMMIRSPGSSLKPLIYAQALQLGLITPNQKLFDVPINLSGYNPENFTKTYMGVVSAREALQYSLNIPAIWLNYLLNDDSMYEILKKAQIRSIKKNKAYYGSSLPVGGFGISLYDSVKLMSTFAKGGELYEPTLFKDANATLTAKLFSPQSAYLISDILSGGTRSEYNSYWNASPNKPKIAYKTGTSAKNVDLVTLGYTPEYTVGVWLGNMNGAPTENISATHSAAKVLFEIFEMLDGIQKQTWFHQPSGIHTVSRCMDGVDYPECKTRIRDTVIENTPVLPVCKMIRPEILGYAIDKGMIRSIQELNSSMCYHDYLQFKPLITSPQDQAAIVINKTLPDAEKKIMISCMSFAPNDEIRLILDDQVYLTSSNTANYIIANEGLHFLKCIDSNSHQTSISFKVGEK